MKKMPEKNKLLRLIRYLYNKFILLNDSPQRIAIGFGLGVFLGMLPGTGPIASLAMAALLRVNKAAALAGSLLTNTWLSLVSLFFSVKIGAWIFGLKPQELFNQWQDFIRHPQWNPGLILPVFAGYLAISLALGIAAFCLIFSLLKLRDLPQPHP